jgi:hypothetical protein
MKNTVAEFQNSDIWPFSSSASSDENFRAFTTFIFSEFISKIHCLILFMNKPFSQLVDLHHVSLSSTDIHA